jgi:hypothetical protein
LQTSDLLEISFTKKTAIKKQKITKFNEKWHNLRKNTINWIIILVVGFIFVIFEIANENRGDEIFQYRNLWKSRKWKR